MNRTFFVHASLFIAGLIYAASFTIAKEVMPVFIKPFGFILLRVLAATALFWITTPLFTKSEKIEKVDFKLMAICTFFGVGINMLLFFKGLETSSPINSAVIMVTTPIFVLLFASFYHEEKIYLIKWAGILLGSAGAILLILDKPVLAFDGNTILGNVYIMLNAISYAVYLVLAKPLMAKYNPLTVSKWMFLMANILIIPFGFNDILEVNWNSFSTEIWLEVGFILVATTYLTYLLNSFALKFANASLVGSYIYLQPVLASFIAIYYGKDMLSFSKIMYACIIFLGVYLVSERIALKRSASS